MSAAEPVLSIVIPCYNEEGNLAALMAAIHQAVDPLNVLYEVVITDDCSNDRSWTLLQELAAKNPCLRAQRLNRNSGESAASWWIRSPGRPCTTRMAWRTRCGSRWSGRPSRAARSEATSPSRRVFGRYLYSF